MKYISDVMCAVMHQGSLTDTEPPESAPPVAVRYSGAAMIFARRGFLTARPKIFIDYLRSLPSFVRVRVAYMYVPLVHAKQGKISVSLCF